MSTNEPPHNCLYIDEQIRSYERETKKIADKNKEKLEKVANETESALEDLNTEMEETLDELRTRCENLRDWGRELEGIQEELRKENGELKDKIYVFQKQLQEALG